MGRRIPTLLVLIIIAFTLVSCKTVATSADYDEETYESVYNLILDKSRSDAVLNLFISLNEGEEDMIPNEYSFLRDYRYRVPGLDRILTNWSRTTRGFLVPSFDTFQRFVSELFASVEKPDYRAIVESGGSPISLYLQQECSDAMTADIEGFISDIDVSAWNEAVVQYSAWANTRRLLYEEDNPEIVRGSTDDETRHMLAKHLVDLFFSVLQRYEFLFRTTPDPEMDSVAAAILGLQ
ncbi:MAG: hypothetical protein IJ863_03085 [Spirochaetales bacterium]|nr:hypothetical protein [Spirochaetales bacterium]